MRWLVVLAIALVPRIAHPCQCDALPSLAISPPSQAVLPPNPRLYVFAPIVDDDGSTFVDRFAVKNIDVDTPIETIHERVIDRNAEYVVYELELGAREGGIELDLTFGGSLMTAFYKITDATQDDTARVIGVNHGAPMEDCSSDTQRIWFDVAGAPAALRFDWDDHTSTVIAPDVLAWNQPIWEIQQPLRMRIGAFCSHTNVPRERLATQHGFGLYALFADGTSRRLGGSELMLGEGGARMPFELLDERMPPPPPPATIERIVEHVDRPATIAIGIAIGGCVGVLYLAFARIAARRRRHRPRYSSADFSAG